MATTYRIHPAIGIARVGNSPEFFIGPELLGEVPEPPGGFKDADCRVKRQAARFRIFAHHDDGSTEEITDAQAEIAWTVHLANRKAAYPGRGNDPAGDLVIDPGARTLAGPDGLAAFDTGQIRFAGEPTATVVPLGEMRTDDEGHLLVLGGAGHSASPGGDGLGDFWGNTGWFDDIADGPVSATITIRADGATPAVTGAWVISAPPKFAPHQDSAITLYDRLLQAMVDGGLATTPGTTSYTRDVFPILQSARDLEWVLATHLHAWPDPVMDPAARQHVFDSLKPVGNMPALNGADSALTPIQHAHMERWKDDVNFVDDWTGPPVPEQAPSPDGMDRAALQACVGGAFFPGIEAGGRDAANRPILDPVNYAEAFRIDHATVAPGQISASMALPWQADFQACSGNWWPAPRPSLVIDAATSSRVTWNRGASGYEGMVEKWHSLGFVVSQGARHVEVERCDTASITLLTPHLSFADVPQGPMGMVREVPLAITFEVVAPSVAVTLEYAPGGAPAHPQLVAASASVTVGPTSGAQVATARLWVIYRTGAAPSALPLQTITVREPVSGRTWTVTIDGNTVPRTTAAVALVLDRSGSMAEDRGDGQSKHASLQQAAEIFVDVMLEDDGVGLVRYDDDAQVVQPVVRLGPGGLSDLGRSGTIDLIRGGSFDPAGATSIGDGIFEGRGILDAAGPGYGIKALTVLTDGNENQPRSIADVASQIDARTYAVGLGTPQNTSAAALQTISGNNGGFLLITGAIGTDNRFLLQKYFLQILAGITQAEVVLDPEGLLVPGAVHRIPFLLTEADSGIDVILLSPHAQAIDFRLQTPNGLILEPWRAMAEPAMRFALGDAVAFYRLALPTQLEPGRFDQDGTWNALLTIGRPRMEPTREHPQGVDTGILRGIDRAPAARRAASRLGTAGSELERRFAIAQSPSVEPTPMVASPSLAAIAPGSARERTLPYSLVVHSYSNLSLEAGLRQSGYEPGATVSVDAILRESGLPLTGEASVWGELIGPDGERTVDFSPAGDGRHRAEFVAGSPGVHRLRIRARGNTRLGMPFTRERTVTAGVWRGGDRPAGTGGGGDRGSETSILDLLDCLLRRGGGIGPDLAERLRGAGLDTDALRRCLERLARERPQCGAD